MQNHDGLPTRGSLETGLEAYFGAFMSIYMVLTRVAGELVQFVQTTTACILGH